jgi:hypothetical protein
MDVHVRLFCVCVGLCAGGAALRRADPPSKESYRLCIGLKNLKSSQGPKGFRAIEKRIKPEILNFSTAFTESIQ